MNGDLTVPDLAGLHRRRSAKWSSVPEDAISLTVAEMDFPLAPAITEALRSAIDRDDVGYAPIDCGRLISAFAGFAERRLGWSLDQDQVIMLPDVVEGLISLCRLLEPGDEVCFAVPAYPPFLRALPRGGVRVRPIGLAEDGSLNLEELRDALRGGARAVVLASPHNPTGRLLPRSELAAIAELCAEYEAYVFSDEIHAPLLIADSPHTCWLEVSDAARDCGVVLSSASKAFNLAGLKAAMAVTAGGRAQRFVEPLIGVGHPGLLGVIAAEAAFADGDQWLDSVCKQLRENVGVLTDALKRELPEVRFAPPEATYLAWLDCRGLALGEDPAQAFLELGRVALSSGPDFGLPGRGFARLNFATSPVQLGEAVARMAHAVERFAAADRS